MQDSFITAMRRVLQIILENLGNDYIINGKWLIADTHKGNAAISSEIDNSIAIRIGGIGKYSGGIICYSAIYL